MATSDRIADPVAVELMDTLQWSYDQQRGSFQTLEQLQNSYDNKINKYTWPTNAKIPTARHFSMVENELADVFESVFLSLSKYMTLMPATKGITAEQLEKSMFALKTTLLYRMKLYYHSLRTLKDCFKLGVGYGIIESINVTPPVALTTRVNAGGRSLSTRVMGVSKPQRAIRYKYVNTGRVIPYPSGTDFNGPDRVDIAFFIDDYPEDQFRAMFGNQPVDGDAAPLKGNVEEIIKEAREYGITPELSLGEVVNKLGGKDQLLTGNTNDGRKIKCRVPVIKCYENYANRHTWLALGKYVVYQEESKFQTMRCPLVKASAWLDSTRFFPMSTPEANRVIAWSQDVWTSMIFDMMVQSAKRPIVYDKTKIKDMGPRGPSPRQAIGADGSVNQVAAYLTGPPIDANTMGVGSVLQGASGDITGQRDLTDKNFTRGGMMSFQDLLSSTSMRKRMTATIINTGFIEEIATQVLAYLQLSSTEEGETFRTEGYDQETGKSYVDEMSVTDADLKNSMDIFINPAATRKVGSNEDSSKLSKFDRMSKSRYFNQWEVARMICDDDSEAAHLVLPREEVAQKQKAAEEAQLQGARQGAAQGGQAPETSLGQQAAQGAGLPQ